MAAGMAWLVSYEKTAGPSAVSPARWPESSSLAREVDGNTLLMFAHPRCPCTGASLAELIRVVDERQSPALVVFYLPENISDPESHDWRQADLVKVATSHPLIETYFDPGGIESQRFGAITSGTCLLYDRRGQLSFSGGITAGRGHQGASQSQSWLTERLASDQHPRVWCAVYGCNILPSDISGREQEG